jgi:hypothetical protein
VGEVGEEPLAAVGLEVFERSGCEVGTFLLGEPGAPEVGEGRLGCGRRQLHEPLAGSACGVVGLVSAACREAAIGLCDRHAPTHALPCRVGGHAAASSVLGQLLLECFHARAKLRELAGQCRFTLLSCCRPGGALLGIEVTRRALIGKPPRALLPGLIPADDPAVAGSNRTGRSSHPRSWGSHVLPTASSVVSRKSAPPRGRQPSWNAKSPANVGLFTYAPKRTRTSTRLSQTRPSTWSPGCQIRPMRPDRPERPRIWTHRTQWTIWMLPRMLPRDHAAHPRAGRHEGGEAPRSGSHSSPSSRSSAWLYVHLSNAPQGASATSRSVTSSIAVTRPPVCGGRCAPPRAWNSRGRRRRSRRARCRTAPGGSRSGSRRCARRGTRTTRRRV